MLDRNEVPDDAFNHAFMVCFPKDPVQEQDDSTKVYTAEGTRPISIVDCSNRILACIFKIVLERAVGQKISDIQRRLLGRQVYA